MDYRFQPVHIIPLATGACTAFTYAATTEFISRGADGLVPAAMVGGGTGLAMTAAGGAGGIILGYTSYILSSMFVRYGGQRIPNEDAREFGRIGSFGGVILGCLLAMHYTYGPMRDIAVNGLTPRPAVTQTLTPVH